MRHNKEYIKECIDEAERCIDLGRGVDPTALREIRADLIADCRSILDKAREEDRATTAEEDREYDKMWASEERVRSVLQRVELENKASEDEYLRNKTQIRATGGSGDWIFRDADTGKEYRSLRPGESFAAVTSERKIPSGVSLGGVVVGAVLGDWRGREECRDWYEGSGSAGGLNVAAELSNKVIDKARPMSVMNKAGCQVMPMRFEEMRVCKQLTDVSAYWTAERSEIAESEGSIGAVTLRARVLACYTEVSLELLRDSANIESVIENSIAQAIAKGLDSAALNGPTGSGIAPTGLYSSSGCDTYSSTGSFVMDDGIFAAEQLWGRDVEPTSWLMTPSGRSRISRAKDGEGRYLPIAPALADIKRFSTSAINSSSTASDRMYLGDFSNCLFGIRSGLEIEASGVSGDTFKRKMIAIRGLLRGDFAVGRDLDVVRMTFKK